MNGVSIMASILHDIMSYSSLQCRKVARELYRQEGCHPYKVAFLPWVQLPLWFVLSFALRNMTGVFPGLSPPEDVLTGLATEGMLWFPDLTAPDPYCILPILLAATNLMNIEVYYCSSLIFLFLISFVTLPSHAFLSYVLSTSLWRATC